MSEPTEADISALRHQHDSLSAHASSLASTLARRRSDISLLRAEAATVAVSLESAKEQLDTALRSESVIRSNSSRPPTTDVQSDAALVKALSGQLEVTKESLRSAEQKRDSLSCQIQHLEQQQEIRSMQERSPRIPSRREQPSVQVPTSRIDDLNLSDLPEDGNAAERRPSGTSSLAEQRRSMRGVEENILQTLREGSEAHSSFRTDHARIWRDVKMPNLGLASENVNNETAPSVPFGVVTERIFEGITSFTSNVANSLAGDSSQDTRIDSDNLETKQPSESIYNRIVGQFSYLSTKGKDGGPLARIIAPKKALERVLDLIGTADPSTPTRKSSVVTEKLQDQTVPPLNIPRLSSGLGNEAKKINVEKDPKTARHEAKIQDLASRMKSRLSGSSKVLSNEQFAQIIVDGVPARFQESALQLVYSTDLNGMSLKTLYYRGSKKSPTLVAIRDTKNRVFGCYAAQPWKTSSARYYGSGETFVFGSSDSSSACVYKWSRQNSFFQFTSSNFLAIGGGAKSHFALWIDEDLLMGTTSSCSTFASPPLTDPTNMQDTGCTEFKILSLEVWSFETHRRN